jgi:hypothetical protein
MSRPKILVQLDGDPQASVFDAVVAVDAGVDQLLQYGGIRPDLVRGLVHGAMFTRGPDDLLNTAIFVGGSDVAAGEEILRQATACFFGRMRVSVMFDASGANTTAAAAVLAAARHLPLRGASALVLAATGPVGQRAVRLLASQGAVVRVASRRGERAEAVCRAITGRVPDAQLEPRETRTAEQTSAALAGTTIVIAAGAAGVSLLPANVRKSNPGLRVAIDLNAVPPSGIEGIEATDRAVDRDGIVCYGAIGVGATKMKIHKAAVRRLFTANDLVLDAEEIFAIGRELS